MIGPLAVISGALSGVPSQIIQKEKRAVNIHYSAHCLNMALQDATRSNTLVRDALDFVREIVNFVRALLKRFRTFDLLKLGLQDDSNVNVSGLRPLCRTRCKARSKSISSVLDNYSALGETLKEISDSNTDESGAKASGFLTKINSFNQNTLWSRDCLADL